MGDYGISAELPQLKPAKIQEVIQRLKELGIPDECSLRDVTIDDLTDGDLLKKIPARKLVKRWEKGKIVYLIE